MEHIYQEERFGPPWFGFSDIYSEQVQRAQDGSHFVEVGSFMGKSASYMCVEIINSGKNIRFDCVDTWAGSIEHQDMDIVKENELWNTFSTNMEQFISSGVVTPIRMKSVDAAKLYEDNSLDFVFIDASHEQKDVEDDIDAWLPKVKEGGMLAGDDLGFEGVDAAVNLKLGGRYTVRGRSWVFNK